MNIINGGEHADNSVDMQEFMIVPVGAPSLAEAVRYGTEVFHNLKSVLSKKGLSTAVGDEGGFAPDLSSNEEAIEVILQAIENAGFTAGKEIYLGLDCAASEYYKDGKYVLAAEGKSFDAEGMVDYLEKWVNQRLSFLIVPERLKIQLLLIYRLQQVRGKLKLALYRDQIVLLNTTN